MVHYISCPICGSKDFKQDLQVKDYTYSGALFNLKYCYHCSGKFTQDVPDINEIGVYYQSKDYISHTNSNKGFLNKLYQIVRKQTLKNKYKQVVKQSGKKTGTLLDVGAGTGAFLQFMQQKGWQVSGVEPNEDARNLIQKNYGIPTNDIHSLSHYKPQSFDVITLWHVLEHIHPLQSTLTQLKNLLKPDGILVIAVPNFESYDAQHYKNYWAAYDVPRHLYHFSFKAMELLMRKHQFSIQAYKPMWFDSYYVSLLSEKYKHNKQKYVAGFWVGFISNMKACFNHKKSSSLTYYVKNNENKS